VQLSLAALAFTPNFEAVKTNTMLHRFKQLSLPLLLIILSTLLYAFSGGRPHTLRTVIRRIDGTEISAGWLTHTIQQLAAGAHVAGLSVTVFNDNRVVYRRAFGYRNVAAGQPMTTTNSIYAASLSKAVFAVLAMKLVESHQLDLDKPLQQYLDSPLYEYASRGPAYWASDYSALRGDTQYAKITARMCLSHTTGFANWRWDEAGGKLRLRFAPGTRYQYSGEGMCYLQFVLEHMLHVSVDSLARRLVFIPAGMRHTGYVWQPVWQANAVTGHDTAGKAYPFKKYFVARAASTMQTTPEDYALFMQSLLQGKLLQPASLKTLFTPQVRIRTKTQFAIMPNWDSDTTENDAIQLSYGLGWGLLQSPYGKGAFKEGHGDGFQHYSIVFPEKKIGILIMTNSDNGESIYQDVLAAAIGDKYTPFFWDHYVSYRMKKG
jgi:CubicO group peptidase (beta-lactamase class C family)